MLFKNLSIKNKMILIIQLVSMLSLLIGFTYVIFSTIANYKEELTNNTIVNANLIGDYCAVPLAFDVSESAQDAIQKLKNIPDIEVGIIYNKTNEVFAKFYNKKSELPITYSGTKASLAYFEGNYLYVSEPIYYENEKAGSILLKVSTAQLNAKTNAYLVSMFLLLLALLIVNYILAFNLQKIVSEPIIEITQTAKKIKEKGNYLLSVPKYGEDEIGQLADEFNDMLSQIHVREESLKNKSSELKKTLDDLKLMQDKLVNSEKLVALGKLIAGVAHEINTPLGAIRSSAGNISNDLNFVLSEYPKFALDLPSNLTGPFYNLIKKSIHKKVALTSKEERIIKKDIAEYFKNNGVENSYAAADTFVDMTVFDNLDQYIILLTHPKANAILEMAYRLTSLYSSTANIEMAADRASKVVFALKNSSRIGNSDELNVSNITEGIESVLTLYNNQIKQGIKVVRKYNSIPEIPCYKDELNQVWTNIIHNAIYAMSLNGVLIIQTNVEDAFVVVSIIDDGQGICSSEIDKIFDPFFTTKPEGEGTGLGLDISKRIIEKHQGKITVSSSPGETIFKVYLPITRAENSSII